MSRSRVNHLLQILIADPDPTTAELAQTTQLSGRNEFLCAADYILSGGNENVLLCLRGTTGFGRTSRAVLIFDCPLSYLWIC